MLDKISMPALNRSVPFLVHGVESNDVRCLLDRFEFSIDELSVTPALTEKSRRSLDVSELGEIIPPETMKGILSEQFSAASEYVYGHPIWQSMREGSVESLRAYLLETRHYLAAAASRMSPSIGQGIGLSPLVLLLSRHFLEEWDHAKFFGRALELVGCDPAFSSLARPLPATLEWIHATRAIGFKSGLSAAVCSGFMEYSSTETEAVRSWHAMLVESGLLSEAANAAIFEHVETDLEFGHSDNWHHAVEVVGPLTAVAAAELLNDVSTIAEAIYRWLSALRDGCASSIVLSIQVMTEQGVTLAPVEADVPEVAAFRGLPVWPSSVLSAVNGTSSVRGAGRVILSAAYAFGEHRARLSTFDNEFPKKIAWAVSSLAPDVADVKRDVLSLSLLAASWLRAIDGHDLWRMMVEEPTDGLIGGYMLENYHYLASASRHIGAAISACPDATLRRQLILHFEDELEHCSIIKSKIEKELGICDINILRPLPTTVSFVGYLETIGRIDWKAYIIISAFLQSSLTECRVDRRNSSFYEAVMSRCSKQAAATLCSLWQHDEIDAELGHDDRPSERLAALLKVGDVPTDSINQAAVAPTLAWGFLDGILQHYRHGLGAVTQRLGWTAS